MIRLVLLAFIVVAWIQIVSVSGENLKIQSFSLDLVKNVNVIYVVHSNFWLIFLMAKAVEFLAKRNRSCMNKRNVDHVMIIIAVTIAIIIGTSTKVHIQIHKLTPNQPKVEVRFLIFS